MQAQTTATAPRPWLCKPKHQKIMKKNYTRPTVCIQRIETENLLAAISERGQIIEGDARGNDFWDDDDTAAAPDGSESWEE